MNEFWKLFAEELYRNLSLLNNAWFLRYYFGKQFTQSTINQVIPLVGSKLGFENDEIITEHKKFDFAFGKNINNHFQINYAIEHENKWDSWYDELLKLSEMNVNVSKVLISYFHWQKENIECVKKNILLNCNTNKLNENFLFIFGPGSFPKNNDGREFVQNNDYKAFIYDGNKFEDLENIKILGRFKN